MRFQSIRWTVRGWLILILSLVGVGPLAQAQATSPNLKMGNPSGAQPVVGSRNNYLLDRPYFATSYNNSKGTPNWVSWRLAKEDLGRAPRDAFYADLDLPAGFLRVDPREYTGSGFDRGHMCPHGDRTATTASSLATFTMTNIIPQSHDVNTMAWEALESYCRDLARTQGKVCYIIDGPAGQGGTGKKGLVDTTPDGKVVVPSTNWKVVMVLDADVASAKDLTANSAIRLIAVIIPNADGAVSEDWSPFLTTVNQVEALTGYTFFSDVDPAVINPLKGGEGFGPTSVPHLVRARISPDQPQPPHPIGPAPIAPARAVVPTEPRPAVENQAMMNIPAIATLKQATEGLTYPSESDEPFEVFSWGEVQGPMTDAKLWNLAQQDPKARIERVDLTRFFARLTEPTHPQSQVDPAGVQRFTALRDALKAELTDIEVIKIGQAEVVYYIIGRTKDGKVVGVRTAATET